MFKKTAPLQLHDAEGEYSSYPSRSCDPVMGFGLNDKPPVVLLLGPHRQAVSGVSTHLNLLFGSALARVYELKHFQVGSEGRNEHALGRLLRLLISPFALARQVIADRVAVVHLNTSLNRRAFWRDLVYLIVAKLAGVHVVYQVHGGDLPEQFAGRKPFMKALLRTALGLPDAIVVLAKCELEAYRNFVPQQDIQLLANAIDHIAYADLPRDANPSQEELRLLYIGRLSREKGLYEALQGLKLARTHEIEAHLTIAGSGPDEAGLRQMVEDLSLTEAVTFVGPVFGDAKLQLFPAADAFLFPSYAEGLPYALLESMAAGVPAITTPVGAIPDVMVDGLHGFFVPPRDALAIAQAIIRVATNRSWLESMGVASRRRIASGYSIQLLANKLAQLYGKVIGARRISTVPHL